MKFFGFKVYAERQAFRQMIGLHIVRYDVDGKRHLVTGFTEEPFADRFHAPAPIVDLGFESAQQLMDDLWNAGLRPTLGKQSEGAMSAMQSHIEDLRKVSFKALDIKV